MADKKTRSKKANTDRNEKRKRGPILCEPGSDEAKRIEDTHGFNAAMKAREKREADKGSTDKKGDS